MFVTYTFVFSFASFNYVNKIQDRKCDCWVRGLGVMVFNATFKNISVISWRSVLLVAKTEDPGETTHLPQITDKFYHTMLYRLHFAMSGTDMYKKK
jgi:hypothetical protein